MEKSTEKITQKLLETRNLPKLSFQHQLTNSCRSIDNYRTYSTRDIKQKLHFRKIFIQEKNFNDGNYGNKIGLWIA